MNSLVRPKVSVCIPNYNYGHFVGEAIQSVLNQTFTDFELIIVDDCSNDNSISVIRSFRDSRIRFYRNDKNIGRLRNINKCISLARGSYVTILPSDGMYSSDSLAKRVQVLDLNPQVGLVFCSAKIIDEKGVILREYRPFENNQIMHGEKFFKILILGNRILTLTALVRRECYIKLGAFNREVASGSRDWEMWLRICLNYDIAYINQPLAYERKHPDNISSYRGHTTIVGINQYKIVKAIFSNLPKEKKHLASLEDQAIKSLAQRILRRSGSNLIHGHTTLARKNISLAISIDNALIRDWRVYIFIFISFLGKLAKILEKMPSTKNVIQTFLFKDKMAKEK